MDLWSKIAETARDVLTEEHTENEIQDVGVSEEESLALKEAWADVENLTRLCEKQRTELENIRRQMSQQEQELRAELSQIKSRLRRSESDRDEGKRKEAENETVIRNLRQELQNVVVAPKESDHEVVVLNMKRKEVELEKAIQKLQQELSQQRSIVLPKESDREQSVVVQGITAREVELEGVIRKLQEELSMRPGVINVPDGEKEVLVMELEEAKRSEAQMEAAIRKLHEDMSALKSKKEGGDVNLRLQVEALSQQLMAERDGNSEERKMEVNALKERETELLKVREANVALQRELALSKEREQQATVALTAVREKSELLRVHLLEREEELDQLTQNISSSKELIANLQSDLLESQEENRQVDELRKLLEDRDKQISRTEKSLQNLEEAVGQMSDDHRSEMTRREKLLKEKFADEFAAKLSLREKELSGANASVMARNEQLEMEMGRVIVAVGEKEKKIDMLLNEINPLREALAETMKKLTEAVDKDQFAVDKRLISNLIVAYFTSDKGKKNEVLSLMLRILDIPKAQREAIYRGTSGWFGAAKFEEEGSQVHDKDKSLGDMWIEYLLKEAGATEEMQHQQEKPKENKV
jgi:chromosome segregation ATPase